MTNERRTFLPPFFRPAWIAAPAVLIQGVTGLLFGTQPAWLPIVAFAISGAFVLSAVLARVPRLF